MIHAVAGPGARSLEMNGVGRLARGVKAVRRRLPITPITRSTTRSTGQVRTHVDHSAQGSPAMTLEVVASPTPHRR